MATLTRRELYDRVWTNPMTKLAKQFGLSDVALHKICRKHDIPTPPQGYWAKKEFGKSVTVTPLPHGGSGSIIIHERAGAQDHPAVTEVLGRVHDALQQHSGHDDVRKPRDAILEASLTRLSKDKQGKDGLVRIDGEGLVSIAVRPESAERAAMLLSALVGAATGAGMHLERGANAARWAAEGEHVDFSLQELADRVEHTPTAQELRAVDKWEADRQASFKRTGYLSEWGRPYIPKWEERYQGRLGFILEEVRDRTQHEYGGLTLRGKFADTKVRDVAKAIPQVVAALATMAVIKRENAAADAARKAAREEIERRRREAERLAALEKKREEGLTALLDVQARRAELTGLLADLDRWTGGAVLPPRLGRLRQWLEARRERLVAATSSDGIEAWLAQCHLFGDEED